MEMMEGYLKYGITSTELPANWMTDTPDFIGIPFYEQYINDTNSDIGIDRTICKYVDVSQTPKTLDKTCNLVNSENNIIYHDILRICDITNNNQELVCSTVQGPRTNGDYIFTKNCRDSNYYWDGSMCIETRCNEQIR